MKNILLAVVPVLVTAALACSSEAPTETTGSTAAAQTSCDFTCQCANKGGYVKDGWLCCKGDANGTICTNSPESIITWLDPTPPDPKKFTEPTVFVMAPEK